MHKGNSINSPDNGNKVSPNWRHRERNDNYVKRPNIKGVFGRGVTGGLDPGPRTLQNNNRHNQEQERKGGKYSRNNDQPSGNYFTCTNLDELSKKDSDEVLTILAKEKCDFKNYLNGEIGPNTFVLILGIFTKICQANFSQTVINVLSNACSVNFLKSLQEFLNKLPFESSMEKLNNYLYHENKNKFWSDLARFFKKVIELLPSKARDELTPILEKIQTMLPIIEEIQDFKIDEKVKNDLENMFKELEKEIQKIEKKNKACEIFPVQPETEEDPPENFRLLSVVPTLQDLQDLKPFLRPCKVKDAYSSVEHYLDIQFRLLREDFISPLRSGVREYLHDPDTNRNSDLRIYRKVSLISTNVTENNVGIILFFGKIKNINWRRSKRLMFGGLLLLSSDNFKTVLFVTIANRDERNLERGYILIQSCNGTIITRDMYKTKFVMLESKIYFEPYLAVLTAMQHIHEENFPMEKYLVHADTSIQLPRYLTNARHISAQLARCLSDDDLYLAISDPLSKYLEDECVISNELPRYPSATDGKKLKYKNWNLPVTHDESWPTANELGLDESQYRAFRCALTQEFAVIQGPPGTGKTFIALEIVRTWLENKAHWKDYGPIVVVCLTNHALDQFLEGILEYTTSMIRVGSRSKSEKLKLYTLMERRKSFRSRKRYDAFELMDELKNQIKYILRSMKKAYLCVRLLTTPDAIVPLPCLNEYVCDTTLKGFRSNEELIRWLIGSEITLYPVKTPSPEEQPENHPEMMPEEEQYNHMDDELELNWHFEVSDAFDPILPIQCIDTQIANIHQAIYQCICAASEMNNLPFSPIIEWRVTLETLYAQRLYFQHKFAQHSVLTEQRYADNNLRWELYWDWIKTSYNNAMDNLTRLEKTYSNLNLRLNEAKQIVDLEVLKYFNVIGLTTTGAAKLHSTLRALRAPIVLVEEAAEILEAHVVCSMTKHCQHTILIGDHKQLRPKASVYQLGAKYNLNISLFERMVNIRGDCVQLSHQHRMRPEVAKLITPSIYETLYNHNSVLGRADIKGLTKNVFFIHHENRETSHNNEESWVNEQEALFLVALARHLLMQGYDAEEITILSTYSGQLFFLTKETARYEIFKQMRVTTVDNYQGEENKIILLSLVRNNGKGNIGFLKEENRVCVALSRARDGLYIMGNMDDLVVKNSIWPKIKKVLQDDNAISNTLQLKCQIHSDQITLVKGVSDFQRCPQGGCMKICGVTLSCKHSCSSICHILNQNHEEYQCQQACNKKCPKDHPCPLRCYQDCKPCEVRVDRKLKCGHTVEMPCSTDPYTFPCYIQVDTTLSNCNHVIRKPCHLPIKDASCTYPCENRLPCGHVCQLRCHVTEDPDHIQYKCSRKCTRAYQKCENNHPCEKKCHEECGPCPEIVEKKRSCGHYLKQVVCSDNVEENPCEKPCNRERSCGHKCPLKCCETCENCQIKVKKISSCGHDVEVKCNEEAVPTKCSGKCKKLLNCNHLCTNECKDPCTTTCKIMVKLSRPGLCGHILQVPCYLQYTEPNSPELLKYCKVPCRAELECKHLCKGSCGSCKQERIHISCAEPCINILICGHQCELQCWQECEPCKQVCGLKCYHCKCNKKCIMPCAPCKNKCARGCKHRKCSKRCSELCDIEPCNEPCQKMLKCRHPCVGFCGDPCPPLCRICDKEELYFSNEGAPDARFVFLEDCGHSIESNKLSKWITESNKFIQMKTCPLCKIPIRKCIRVRNQIKKDLQDVLRVKQKVFSCDQAYFKKKQVQYMTTLKTMSADPNLAEFPELKKFLDKLTERGHFSNKQKKQVLGAQEIEAFRVIFEIVRQMFDVLIVIQNRTVYLYQFVKKQVAMLVESLPTRWQISNQKLADIQLELQRLNYIAELCKEDAVETNEKELSALTTKLLSTNRFTEQLESAVQEEIKRLQHIFKQQITIERQMIVKSMDFKQGHWYKCPEGHIYVIGECGGAMQESKCPEC